MLEMLIVSSNRTISVKLFEAMIELVHQTFPLIGRLISSQSKLVKFVYDSQGILYKEHLFGLHSLDPIFPKRKIANHFPVSAIYASL